MKDIRSIKPFPFDIIQTWYQKNGRQKLPWRQVYDLPDKERVYKVWIAEVMLQQTQVERVITYYNRFIHKYPSIESLAATTYEELFPYYQGLGYYSRAKRMIELAIIIVNNYHGIFPNTMEELRKLPGIGAYTAQAILAFGYNRPVLAIDANLEKIFSRYYIGTRYADKAEQVLIIKKLQADIHNTNLCGRDINNALMDFGALISTTFDKIDQSAYPLRECLWFQTKGHNEIRELKVKKQRLKSNYACLVFLHENHKKYWSSHKKTYEPFLIEPIGGDDRNTIQDYFSATYGIEVSVRPSWGNAQYSDGYVKLFYAQIQTGNADFTIFLKEEKDSWLQRHLTTS